MNIRPKNILKFQGGGVSTVEWTNPKSSWYSRSGNDIIEGTYQRLKALHDKWQATGKWEDYNAFVSEVNKMNNDQRYGYAPNYLKYSKNNSLFTNEKVGQWQSTIKNNYNYINDAIGKNFGAYHPVSPTPTSGDNQNKNWVVDNYWAGITQDRTPWGYYNDENDIDYQHYKDEFAKIGIDYRPANKENWGTGNALFGFLVNNPNPSAQTTQPNETQITKTQSNGYTTQKPLPEIDLKKSMDNYWKDKNPDGTFKVSTGHKEGGYGFDWKAVGDKLKDKFPLILEAGRLIGNYYNNERVYGESLKGIRPDLMQSYNTYRQVVGDEATKQAYYRRAAEGETKAAQPFTSDADKQMAYRFESRRAGNELRAQGDLADNQRIRETSEQSAQHADANTQRATEVANANLKSINYANSLKHNLLAQKHAANWTSIDNFLQGIGTRWRQKNQDEESIMDDLFLLQEKERLLTDPNISAARTKLDQAVKNHTVGSETDWYHDDIKKAQLELERAKIRAALQSKRNYRQYKLNPRSYIDIVKTGGKITHKKKDDLLYKSTRDSVEHFRKMSKMSSDAQNRKRVKIEKLTPPPKTKKLQQGGVAPFTIYKPIVLGGETTRTTETSSGGSSKSSSKEKGTDILDLIKELFKNLGGLPSDSNGIYTSMLNLFKKQSVYGTEMSTEDLATMFLQQMQKVDAIKFNRSEFDKAKAIVDGKNANSEFAISPDGRVAVQNQNTGEVSLKKIEDIDSKVDNPLTNQNLLDLRAYNPNLAFNQEAIRVATYATTIDDITKFITDQLNNVKETENTIEGYTKKDSHLIKEGLQLLADAPEGVYKFAKTTKDNSVQINAALNYLQAVMPGNMKTLLALHTNGEPGKAVAYLASSRISNTNNLKFSAVTGQGAENAEKIKSNPIMQMIQEQGGTPRNYQLITRDSNIQLSVDGTSYSQIPKITEDTSVANMLATSGFQVVTDSMYGITFGDQNISPEQLKDIMYPNEGAMVVTLPCKIVNGHKEVNLGVIDSYKEAVNEVESKGLSKNSQEYMQELGKALQEKGLTSLLTANGYPDKNKFSQFLVFSGYTTDKIKNLDTSSQFIEKVKNPDSALEDRMIKALSTDNKKTNYKLDIDYYIYGDDVYRGTVFIPLNNNLNAAINAYGSSVSVENARELENKKQNFDKASNMKPSNSDILYGTETE